jgi:hypothetical protein
MREEHAWSSSSNGRPGLDSGKLNDHTPVAEILRIYPMMAVDDTEDIHAQCILSLCSSRYFAFGREYMFKELLSLLALYLRSLRKHSIPVVSVREHCHLHGVTFKHFIT